MFLFAYFQNALTMFHEWVEANSDYSPPDESLNYRVQKRFEREVFGRTFQQQQQGRVATFFYRKILCLLLLQASRLFFFQFCMPFIFFLLCLLFLCL